VKTRLAVIWAAIVAAGVTVFGVVTGRRRRRRAERQRAREERRAKRAQRKAQGGRKRAASAARVASVTAGASMAARSTQAGSAATEPAASAEPVASTAAPSNEDGAGRSDGDAEGDDLRAIKGLGAVTASKLREAGITTYAQIAAWTPEQTQDLAERLGIQPGRIASDDWAGQARRLLDERSGGSAHDGGAA
jgi:large subunit ribosomal protein L21